MRQQTFFQSISIFTARIWLHYNNLRGDTRHSYLNDFSGGISHTNHFLGYNALKNMISQYREDSAFKNVIVYDNINNVPIYDEVFVPSQNNYRVRLNCHCKFEKDENGNFFYQGYESYDPQTGEIIFNQANQEQVRAVSRKAWYYMKKRRSMPQVVHPEANENRMEQGRGNIDPVQSIQERLRDEKIFAGLSPVQLSHIADMLMQKGKAA